jgi:hypothetical protein
MTALDKIRLIGLLRRDPATAGSLYFGLSPRAGVLAGHTQAGVLAGLTQAGALVDLTRAGVLQTAPQVTIFLSDRTRLTASGGAG